MKNLTKIALGTIFSSIIFSGPVMAFDLSLLQLNSIERLGAFLYMDENLSKNRNQSCMTCHHPSAGFADPDNAKDPTTFPVSDGSDPKLFGGRNAPTAAYSGFSPSLYYDAGSGLYVGGMFWDGRATGWTLGDPIAEQAQGPFLNPVEMGLSSKADVVRRVYFSFYSLRFRLVFGWNAFRDVDMAYDNIGRAIAAFERSGWVTRFNSKFDKFWEEQGRDISTFGTDDNGNYTGVPADFSSQYYSRQEAEGLALFNALDKGKCAACHLTTNHEEAGSVYAPMFTDFTYDNLGIPANPQIELLTGVKPAIDYGLGARVVELQDVPYGPEVKIENVSDGLGDKVPVVLAEAGKFKVATLRNVARTAPYGHNGYFISLEDIIHFYNTRDVDSEGWEAPEVSANVNDIELGNLELTVGEEASIVAFLKTLTDNR